MKLNSFIVKTLILPVTQICFSYSNFCQIWIPSQFSDMSSAKCTYYTTDNSNGSCFWTLLTLLWKIFSLYFPSDSATDIWFLNFSYLLFLVFGQLIFLFSHFFKLLILIFYTFFTKTSDYLSTFIHLIHIALVMICRRTKPPSEVGKCAYFLLTKFYLKTTNFLVINFHFKIAYFLVTNFNFTTAYFLITNFNTAYFSVTNSTSKPFTFW